MIDLSKIQAEIKAPKGQFNKFGNYRYRSCEDILESVKPVLSAHKCWILISDSIEMIADRIYVKSTATITDGTDSICASAFAREALAKKGMDESQITGAASSYARKYALNGLFAIDDTADADAGGEQVERRDDSKLRPEQILGLMELIKKTNSDNPKFWQWCGVSSVAEIKAGDFNRVAGALKMKLNK